MFALYRSLSSSPPIGPIYLYSPEFQASDPGPSHYPLEPKTLVLAGPASPGLSAKEGGIGLSWQPWAQHVHPQAVLAFTDCYNH